MAVSFILLLSVTSAFASDVSDNETIADEIIMETLNEVESQDMLSQDVKSEKDAIDSVDEKDLSAESDILKEADESEKMYGYWVNSADMKNLNLTDLKKHGVTDILLNYYAYTRFNQSDVELFISDANNSESEPTSGHRFSIQMENGSNLLSMDRLIRNILMKKFWNLKNMQTPPALPESTLTI